MKKRSFLPLIGYFIGWFYWKTVLGPWPTLLFVAAFFAWGIAVGWEKQNRGPMHYLWAGVTALIGLAITMNRCHATADWSTLALHVSVGLWVLSYLGRTGDADGGGLCKIRLLPALRRYGNQLRPHLAAVPFGKAK